MDKSTPFTHPPDDWSGTVPALREQLRLKHEELKKARAEIEQKTSLLRKACDWIQREVDNTEVELPDAEDLLVRINQVAPAITEEYVQRVLTKNSITPEEVEATRFPKQGEAAPWFEPDPFAAQMRDSLGQESDKDTHCNHEVLDGRCLKCGEEYPLPKFCRHCAITDNDGTVTCHLCGEVLEQDND